MPKADANNSTATIETLLPHLPGAPEQPEDLLDELHAGIGCLLKPSVSPIMEPEEIGFIATALDGALERLRSAMRPSEGSAP